MMSFPSSFSLSSLRPHLYLCLMWNLVKRNRCDCVRVCVALGVIRPFGSWHFSGAGDAVRPCQVAFRLTVQCFHFLYLAVFIFASERDFPIDWTHDKQQPQLLSTHTHTQLGVCVCVSHSHMAPAGTVDRMPFWPSNSKRCGVNRNHLQLHRPLPVEITRLSSVLVLVLIPVLVLVLLLELLPPLHIFLFLIIFN